LFRFWTLFQLSLFLSCLHKNIARENQSNTIYLFCTQILNHILYTEQYQTKHISTDDIIYKPYQKNQIFALFTAEIKEETRQVDMCIPLTNFRTLIRTSKIMCAWHETHNKNLAVAYLLLVLIKTNTAHPSENIWYSNPKPKQDCVWWVGWIYPFMSLNPTKSLLQSISIQSWIYLDQLSLHLNFTSNHPT